MGLSLDVFKKERDLALKSSWTPRPTCSYCCSPQSHCYCQSLHPFKSTPKFLFLIHPMEARKTVATGRMAHLSIQNSLLLQGKDFTHNDQINQLIHNPLYEPVLLYPTPDALPLDEWVKSCKEKSLPKAGQTTGQNTCPEINQSGNPIEDLPKKKTPLVIIIDGTWRWATGMYLSSYNLQKLNKIRLFPEGKSKFIIKKQPAEHCLSTIESAHEVIEQYGEYDPSRPHDSLLELLDNLVSVQLKYIT